MDEVKKNVLKEEKLDQYFTITACGYDLINNMYTRAELLTEMYHISCNRSKCVSRHQFTALVEREEKFTCTVLDK